MWLLFTDGPEEPVRKWNHGAIALAQLWDEGWEISGPYLKRLRQRFRGMDWFEQFIENWKG